MIGIAKQYIGSRKSMVVEGRLYSSRCIISVRLNEEGKIELNEEEGCCGWFPCSYHGGRITQS